jgi:hypothetical protein
MLLAYFLLVIGQLRVTDTHHIMLNILGALFIVIAMHEGNSVPLPLTIVLWLLISLYGLYKHHIATTE